MKDWKFWATLLVPSLMTILILGIGGIYHYGQLTEDIKVLSKEIEHIHKRLDDASDERARIRNELQQLNQNFIRHLEHHNIPNVDN